MSRPRPGKLRPMPADFSAVAAGRSIRQLMGHYDSSARVISRWLGEAGIKLDTVRCDARPVPDDFASLALTMTRNKLRVHYGCHRKTVARWLAITGLEPVPVGRKRDKEKRPAKARPAPCRRHTAPTRQRSYAGPKSAFTMTLPRDSSIEGQAADHLRRTGPVYRCTASGRANQAGEFWRYGVGMPMTGDEMIERAKRRGFDPDAWQSLGLAISGHEADKRRAGR